MINEKQKDLLIQLRNLFDELCEESNNDDFNSLLGDLKIFNMSLDDASNELTNVIENITEVNSEKFKQTNDNVKVYKQVINSLMSNDHNGTWDEIWNECDGDFDKAMDTLKMSLEELIGDDGPVLDDKELEFYQEQLDKLYKVLILGYDTYNQPIYKYDNVNLKNGDTAKVFGINKHGNLVASNKEGFQYDLDFCSVIK